MVISRLKKDHRRIEGIFRRIEAAREPVERESLLSEAATELESHASAEEIAVYPRALALPAIEPLARHAEAEHDELRDLVAQALSLSPKATEWLPLVEQLRDTFAHHARAEEKGLFPAMKRHFTAAQLAEMDREIAIARETYAAAS